MLRTSNYKSCTKCNYLFEYSFFCKNKSRSDGYASECKACEKAYREANKAKLCKYQKEYSVKNKDKTKARGDAWYQNNKTRCLKRCKQYRLDKPEVNRAVAGKQRAKRTKRNVQWSDDELNQLVMSGYYEKAVLLSKSTGIDFQVDHVIPLQGKTVSGLHHYNNLQILTRSTNRLKSNKY